MLIAFFPSVLRRLLHCYAVTLGIASSALPLSPLCLLLTHQPRHLRCCPPLSSLLLPPAAHPPLHPTRPRPALPHPCCAYTFASRSPPCGTSASRAHSAATPAAESGSVGARSTTGSPSLCVSSALSARGRARPWSSRTARSECAGEALHDRRRRRQPSCAWSARTQPEPRIAPPANSRHGGRRLLQVVMCIRMPIGQKRAPSVESWMN